MAGAINAVGSVGVSERRRFVVRFHRVLTIVASAATFAAQERLAAMKVTLTNMELEILRKLAAGAAVTVPAQLRIRLELAGVIREGAKGLRLTAEGRLRAMQKPSTAELAATAPDKVAFDKRGRRMPLRRKSVF